jgi:hypothetical protein
MFKNCIIFVNDIINRTGEVMSHKANKNLWKCLLYPKIIAALLQKWQRKLEGGES